MGHFSHFLSRKSDSRIFFGGKECWDGTDEKSSPVKKCESRGRCRIRNLHTDRRRRGAGEGLGIRRGVVEPLPTLLRNTGQGQAAHFSLKNGRICRGTIALDAMLRAVSKKK